MQPGVNIVEKLAAGGMADVYLAERQTPDGIELVAVKRMRADVARKEQFIAMFKDEARILGTLNHPNIARLIDFGEDEEGLYVIMEYLAGEDLWNLMESRRQRRQMLGIAECIGIAVRLAAALDHAHNATDKNGRPLQIVHRDLSPTNVIVTTSGSVKLVDFGVARAAQRLAVSIQGAVKGSVGYMAPEQIYRESIDARSDIFVLGILLYEMLTMRPLFSGTTNYIVAASRISSGRIPAPSTFRGDVPRELEAILFRAMALSPDDRYQSASEIMSDLEAFAIRSGIVFDSGKLAQLVIEHLAAELESEDTVPNAPIHRDLLEDELTTRFSYIDRSPTRRPGEPLRGLKWGDRT